MPSRRIALARSAREFRWASSCRASPATTLSAEYRDEFSAMRFIYLYAREFELDDRRFMSALVYEPLVDVGVSSTGQAAAAWSAEAHGALLLLPITQAWHANARCHAAAKFCLLRREELPNLGAMRRLFEHFLMRYRARPMEHFAHNDA